MPIQQSTYATPRLDLGEAFLEYNPDEMGFVATQALPVLGVPKESGTLSVVTRENLAHDANAVIHSNGAAYNRVNLITEDKAYACLDYGLEEVLTDRDRLAFMTDFDAEVEVVRNIRRKLLQAQEIRVATALFNTTTWTGAALYTDNSANPWDTITTDIIGQIQAAKDLVRVNCGYVPDSMLIGAGALANCLKNTAIIGRTAANAANTMDVIKATMAAMFGLKNIIIGQAAYNSAKQGQSFAGSDIWSDDYALIFKMAGPGMKDGGLGRTLIWTPMGGEVVNVEQYREEQTKGDVFRCTQYLQELVFDAYFGHLLKIDA
jgi:hypothetical protein